LAPSVATNRLISRLANDRNRASVVTRIQGLTTCEWMLRSTPPDPVLTTPRTAVGSSSAPRNARTAAKDAASRTSRQPAPNGG
jgi:hypothetical protein